MRAADVSGALAVATVAVVAATGGAFSPAERLVAGVAMALVALAAPLAFRSAPAVDETMLLAAVGWGGVSAMIAAGYPLAAKEMVGGWLVAWLVWTAITRLDRSLGALIGALVAVATVMPALAIVAECAGAGRLRMGGLYVNPNVAAALMVPAIPAMWCLLTAARLRSIVWLVSAVLAVGVLLSGSRAGLLALVVVVGVMLPRGRARWTGVAAAAAAAVAFGLWRFVQNPDSLAWHRLEIWRALWPLVVDHPWLGVGPGWLEDATGVVRIAHEGSLARWGHIIGSAESTPFGLLVRTGMVGLGLAVLGGALWWRRERAANRARAGGAGAVLAAIGVMAFFHDYLMVDVVLWWWAALLGAVFPLGEEVSDGAIRSVSGLMCRQAAGLAGGFLVLWTIAQPASARWLWWSAPPTPALAERAVRADPWYAEPERWRINELLLRDRWSWETAAEALGRCRRAAANHPGSSRVWTELGRVHGRVATDLGPWPDAVDGARDGYRRATELEPHLPWGWLQWAQLERSLGRTEAALLLTERAVTEEPNFVRGWLLAARLSLDAGDPVGAREAFTRARAAFELRRPGAMTEYERDLLQAPSWQVQEIDRALVDSPVEE